MNKADIILDWAKGWPELEGYLKLNAIVSKSGDKTLATETNEAQIIKYINGQALKELTFALSYMVDWSDGFDLVNTKAMALGQSWIDWVFEQEKVHNYPALPNVQEVAPLQNIPTLAMVYESDNIAKYQFQCTIKYIE